MKSIVVAYDKKFGIGSDGDLLWQRNLSADLKHFKELTTGHVIIMGRKTFDSIGKALPNRQNIVITRNQDLRIADVDVANGLLEAYSIAQTGKEVFVIGGAQIYCLAIDSIDTIYATEVDAVFDSATSFFPTVDTNIWLETVRDHHSRDERNFYDYDFVTYVRR